MSKAIEKREPAAGDVAPPAAGPGTLFAAGLTPAAVIAQVSEIAGELRNVLRAQGLTANIQGKEYVLIEGWSLLAGLLGVYPVVAWSRELPDGAGWESRAEGRTLAGQVVGAAEAECRRDERSWSRRESYALRSMAQTRATSKCLRLTLGFIVSMAGYQATPAEEMPPDDAPRLPVGQPVDAPPFDAGAELMRRVDLLSDDLRREFKGLAKFTGASGGEQQKLPAFRNIAAWATGVPGVDPTNPAGVLAHMRAVAGEGFALGGDDPAEVVDAEVVDDASAS